MREAIPPLPQYAFIAWCSEYRDNFIFTLVSIQRFSDFVFTCTIVF